ncbi:MAG: alpha/beta fold hydrolase [Acidimicrobiales bacterium]
MLERAEWVSSGERIPVAVGGGAVEVFVRVAGDGPWCTLVHGYPTSSWDWAHVAPRLEAHRRTLALDLLGFGASDKPHDHIYSIHEQADIVEAAWDWAEVEETELVSHDYGDSVAQELVARAIAGTLDVELTAWSLLNGGIYPDLHRPTLGQTLLLDPDSGQAIADAVTPETFSAALLAVLGPAGAPGPELSQHWDALADRGGSDMLARLIHYIGDRSIHAERWIHALEHSPVPPRFVWGPEDPVSGAHVIVRLRERFVSEAIFELPGIGHYPQWEAPDAVADAVLSPR